MSGEPDSNRRPSPWEGDILPLNYHRASEFALEFDFLRKFKLSAIPPLKLLRNFVNAELSSPIEAVLLYIKIILRSRFVRGSRR